MNLHRLLACVLLGFAGCAHSAALERGVTTEDPAPSGSPSLREYKESYYRDLGGRFVGSLTDYELLLRITESRVLYLGDHHDDRDLHRDWLSILDSLRTAGIPMVLGIESIGRQDEGVVDDYLRGRIDQHEMRQLVRARWPGSWLDSRQVESEFYRGVLAKARSFGAPVFALEPTPRRELRYRDPIMVSNILAAAERHPRSLIVVIAGHAHLLGPDRLIAGVGLPWVALGARPSVTLRNQLATFAAPAAARYLVTESGVLLRRNSRGSASSTDS